MVGPDSSSGYPLLQQLKVEEIERFNLAKRTSKMNILEMYMGGRCQTFIKFAIPTILDLPISSFYSVQI